KRTYLEVHQYANQYYSGTTMECLPPANFDPIFTKITTWAKENNQFLFLGEFGTAATPECLATLNHYFELMQDPVWRGWTYWAGGRWWGAYGFALNMLAETPSPQWSILKKYFYVPMAQAAASSKASAPKPPQPLEAAD
ncbi:MAG: glycoside hydrolase family 5 protein, partial [Moraxellaceae bacterium]